MLPAVREPVWRFPLPEIARNERGQSLVEVALLLPILVFLILAGGDLARAFALQLAVQNGARAGAEAAAMDFTPTTTEAENRAKDEMSRTPGMDITDPSLIVTASFKLADGTTDCPSTTPTVAVPCYATVRVQYTFHTVTPWPLVPNSAQFDRTTSMRTIKGP
jgi:Flp pilus assembly protein TadG